MALLDVSDIVMDPDFTSTLLCKRQTQTIGDNGRAVNTAEEIPFIGVVTMYDGDVLERLDYGERAKGAIMVHSKFILRDSGPGVSADIIVFNGREYTAAVVDSYSHFGAGFSATICELLPIGG